MKKRLYQKYWLYSILVFLAVSVWVNLFLIPNYIVKIRTFNTPENPSSCDNEYSQINIKSKDGLLIKSFLSQPFDRSDKVVILVHGIRSDASSFCHIQKELGRQGIHSIAIDLRAHGTSEGKYCTFGVREKQDISRLVDKLIEMGYHKIGIWGQSLGGAVSIQSLAYDKRLSFGIIESTFSSWNKIVKDYIYNIVGVKVSWISNFWINRAAHKAGFSVEDANPITYCKSITVPVLMIHGVEDEKIKISYGKQNYEALASQEKKFIAVNGAHHNDVHHIGGKSLLSQVITFIKNQ